MVPKKSVDAPGYQEVVEQIEDALESWQKVVSAKVKKSVKHTISRQQTKVRKELNVGRKRFGVHQKRMEEGLKGINSEMRDITSKIEGIL